MNILIVTKKDNLLKMLPFIKIDLFNVVASTLSAKEIAKNNSINFVVYDDSVSINKSYFNKNIKLISFSDFLKITLPNNAKKQKTQIQQHTQKDIVNNHSKLPTKDTVLPQKDIVSNHSKLPTKDTVLIQKDIVNSHDEPMDSANLSDCSIENTDNHFDNINNNVYAFTSVKGGVGVSSMIKELINVNTKKLILDLAFISGGSDLSYYLDLPQVPHLGTYIKNSFAELSENSVKIDKNTIILQSPPVSQIYNGITKENILGVLKNYKDTIIVDMPLSNMFSDLIFMQSKIIFVVTNGTPMEINRIQKNFNNYIDKVICLVVNCKNKHFKTYCKECNLSYIYITDVANQLKEYL